jgi:acyl-CoA thioester hydrolase
VPFTWDVHVRFNDCDGMRHVNNAVYLTYVEDARIAFFQALNTGDGRGFFGRGIIVARTEVDYVRPAMFGRGPVQVTVDVQSIGRRSWRMGYVLGQGGEEVARSVTVMVAYDYKTQTSRPLEDVERAALEEHLVSVG